MFSGHDPRATACRRRYAVGRVIRLTAIAASALTFAGCPYSGPIPLGEPHAAEFLPGLLGEWDAIADDGSRASDCPATEPNVTIRRLDATGYQVSYPGHDCRPVLARAFVSRLDGALFLNVSEPVSPAGEAPEYLITRLYPGTDTIRMRYLNDTLEDVTSVAQLRDRVRQRIDDPAIYDDEFMLVRHRP